MAGSGWAAGSMTAVASVGTSTGTRSRSVRSPGPSSYTPTQTRCGRPPAWLMHPAWPGGSGRMTLSVSTPEGLADQREVGPCTGEGGGVGQHPDAHVLGEGLAQPHVVPPAHGDQVAEPH